MAVPRHDEPDATESSPLLDVNIDELMATPLAVSSVIVRGASRTRQQFLEKLIAPVVSTGGSFSGVVEDVHDAVERIRATGVFSGADAFLAPGDDNAAAVIVTVTEKPTYQIRTGTSVRTSGDRDASVEASVVWRNLTGRTDTLRASTSYWGGVTSREGAGVVPGNSVAVDYTAPFVYGLRNSAFARIEQLSRMHDESHFRERAREAVAGVLTPVGTFSVCGTWREVCEVDEKASVLVRDEAGHSWKGSITHEIGIERRDDAQLPTSGYCASLQTEMAGMFGGDARFRKIEAGAQLHVPVGASGLSVALCGRVGAAGGMDGKIGILDRFFLGGPNSLRGFAHRGVGPRESDSALGGSAFYSLGVYVSAPTPRHSLLHQFFRARVHGFAVAGDVGALNGARESVGAVRNAEGVRRVCSEIRESARTAIGIGIAGDTAFGRIELNLTSALSLAPNDVENTGVQFGLSREFM